MGGELKTGCLSRQKKIVVIQPSSFPKGVLLRAKLLICSVYEKYRKIFDFFIKWVRISDSREFFFFFRFLFHGKTIFF